MKKNPKIVIFVQARMGNSRLPGKVLKPVLGKPALLHQLNRMKGVKTADQIVVITSNKKKDDAIENFCKKNKLLYFRGSETDLLDRHYQAAKKFKADFVVKVPSDCPFADPVIIDSVINLWLKNQDKFDYVSNYHPPTFPDGLDAEGCTFSVLEQAWREADKPHEREHTFPFIWDNPKRFRIGNVLNPRGDMFLTHRWCLDYEEDLIFIRKIMEHFKNNPNFSTNELLKFLEKNPEIAKINEKYSGVNWYRNVPGQLATVGRHLYKNEKTLKLDNSLKLLRRAKKVIPCATQTLSKGYTQWSVGTVPLFIESAQGCEVYDVDGNSYIDYAMALGPMILGYNDPDVTAAAEKQLRKGTMFTLPSPLETEAAEALIRHVPSAEMVRFGKNGSDATAVSVKLARAFTGKEKVITCGYHGWQDWYIATTERDAGVLPILKKYAYPMTYNDISSLKKIIAENKGEIAALIMEPVYTIEPEKGFLEEVRAITKKENIVLIFDEVYTAFRWSMGGAQEYFKVTPDLTCLGKAMTSGYPLSAVVGRRDIMQHFEEVFFSFTYGGETVSLAALIATIKKMENEKVHQYIWDIGKRLKKGIQESIKKHGMEEYLDIIGYPVKTAFNFKGNKDISPLEMKTFFQQECASRGILFIGYHLPSYAHKKEHIDFTIQIYDEVMGLLKQAIQKGNLKKLLRGKVITQIFKNVGDRSSGLKKND